MQRTAIMPLAALMCAVAACSGGVANEESAATGNEASASAAAATGTIALTGDQMTRIGVTFATIAAVTDLPIATVPATVAPPPNARVAVAAVIPGVVTRTLVVEGQSVRRGQPLAMVAAREMFTIAAGIDRASARVAAAGANDRRLAQLAEEGVIAGARAEEARAALREAEAELREQRRIARLVNGAPDQGTYTLTAPIAGTITTAAIQTGSPVDEATAAYVIDAASRYELTAQLPERLIGQVRPGMAVRLPGDVRGEVTSVAGVIDPETRSATLRAHIPAGPGIVSGRALPATLLTPAPAGAIAAPAVAVTDIGGRPTAFVRTDAGVAVRVVEVGDTADGQTVILSGLKAGDQVAVGGISELKSLAMAQGQD